MENRVEKDGKRKKKKEKERKRKRTDFTASPYYYTKTL